MSFSRAQLAPATWNNDAMFSENSGLPSQDGWSMMPITHPLPVRWMSVGRAQIRSYPETCPAVTLAAAHDFCHRALTPCFCCSWRPIAANTNNFSTKICNQIEKSTSRERSKPLRLLIDSTRPLDRQLRITPIAADLEVVPKRSDLPPVFESARPLESQGLLDSTRAP